MLCHQPGETISIKRGPQEELQDSQAEYFHGQRKDWLAKIPPPACLPASLRGLRSGSSPTF